MITLSIAKSISLDAKKYTGRQREKRQKDRNTGSQTDRKRERETVFARLYKCD
jgi:hypothetical protein